MSPSPTKKTVYVDVDDEITGVIDKVRSAKESIVALVLPRRASVFHSAVNMKLLKRSADQNDKKVVLITSEPNLMPLAGAAGLYVAANLQSKPYIPSASAKTEPPIQEESATSEDPEIDPNTPIGDLAEDQAKTEPIEIDNSSKSLSADPKLGKGGGKDGKAGKKAKAPKDKNKKIPNFNKFRLLLIAGVGVLVFLLAFGYWAMAVAPKAKVTLRTESRDFSHNSQFTVDTASNEVDLEEGTLPGRSEALKKNESEKVPATGEKDNGTKAGGTVQIRNCTDGGVSIPAGTGVSNGSLTFVTQSSIRLDDGDFNSGGQCKNSGEHVRTVNVVAQNNGEQYNLSPRTYTVAGFSGVIGQGEQMSGGTSKIVKVVTAQDVETAKKRISDKQNTVVEEIKSNLEKDGYVGLVDTFAATDAGLNVSPAVGTEAGEVTVSGEITYTMLGVKEDDLKNLIKEKAKDSVDTAKQSILDYGFDDATFAISGNRGNVASVNLTTNLVVGPELNQPELKKELAGKKTSEAEELLKSRPGITDAKVELGPFWVSKVPGKESKVIFIIEQADGTQIDT
jgi:hypothetical protein